MKRLITTISISLICISSFSQIIWGSQVKSEYDKFDNYKKFTLIGNFLKQEDSYNSTTALGFGARCLVKDSMIRRCIILTYRSSNWLFIESGESLVMLIDGKRLGLTGDGSSNHREVLTGGKIEEMAYYYVVDSVFEMLAKAEKIEIKLIGSSSYDSRFYFGDNNKLAIQNFYNKYVKPTSSEIIAIPAKAPHQPNKNIAAGVVAGVLVLSVVLALLLP